MPIQVQAKDSRSVLAAAIPTGSKANKPQTVKMTAKGKKQSAGKKNNGIPGAELTGDKNDKTKPQVTHELSMVCQCVVILYCYLSTFH